MADVERGLLTAIIRTGEFSEVLDARIGLDHFIDKEHSAVWSWITEHFEKYGKTPGMGALRASFPNYKVTEKTDEPMSYYIDEVRLDYRYDIIASAVTDAGQLFAQENDRLVAVDKVTRMLTSSLEYAALEESEAMEVTITEEEVFDSAVEKYERYARDPRMTIGYPTGFFSIDAATLGLQAGQLVTFAGPPKIGKTAVIATIANELVESGLRVLMISFEMGHEELQARWMGTIAQINYRLLLKGKIDNKARDKLARARKRLPKLGEFIITEDVEATTTVSGISAKIKDIDPDVVIIDGVYMMDDENGEAKGSSAAITNITRGLKRVAKLRKLPIVITTQTLYSKMRGNEVSASSLGYSNSFQQDSNAVIVLEEREDLNGIKERWLKVVLSRMGRFMEVQIDLDWDRGYVGEMGEPDTEDEDVINRADTAA